MSRLIILILVIGAVSCKKNNYVPVCDGSTPTFVADIEPIAEANCYECHGYTSYEDMAYSFSDGSFEKKVLIKQSMPRGGKTLTNEELDLIRCWVDNGFPKE